MMTAAARSRAGFQGFKVSRFKVSRSQCCVDPGLPGVRVPRFQCFHCFKDSKFPQRYARCQGLMRNLDPPTKIEFKVAKFMEDHTPIHQSVTLTSVTLTSGCVDLPASVY